MTIRARITLIYAATILAVALGLYLLLASWLTTPALRPGEQPGRDVGDPVFYGVLAVLVIAAALAGGWFVAGRVLAPIDRITGLAGRIAAGNLHERIALDGPPDELRRLAETFDGMLARLEAAFAAQRRFAANASHELLTPLATSRALLEVAAANPGALPEATGKLLLVNERSTELVVALLELARAEHGLANPVPVNLTAIAEVAVAALDAGEVTVSTDLRPVTVAGEPALLARLVGNLLANAVRHNHPGGTAKITVAAGQLLVTNTGPVVSPEQAGQLFEPFVRAAGRTRAQGHGLGLAIARAVVTAHRGSITATPNQGGGLTVDVRF